MTRKRKEMKVTVMPRGSMKVLPPRPGLCQVCATKHEADWPHNQQSLYYQVAFWTEHGRYPTWRDAMQHCTAEMQAFWIEELGKLGVKVPEVAAP